MKYPDSKAVTENNIDLAEIPFYLGEDERAIPFEIDIYKNPHLIIGGKNVSKIEKTIHHIMAFFLCDINFKNIEFAIVNSLGRLNEANFSFLEEPRYKKICFS